MKLTKIQFHLYIIENGCRWKALSKKYKKWYAIYMEFSESSKSGTMAKILEAIKKRKPLNQENSILFVGTTSIKVGPDVNENRDDQEQSIRHPK